MLKNPNLSPLSQSQSVNLPRCRKITGRIKTRTIQEAPDQGLERGGKGTSIPPQPPITEFVENGNQKDLSKSNATVETTVRP